jgi:hypothetical protein
LGETVVQIERGDAFTGVELIGNLLATRFRYLAWRRLTKPSRNTQEEVPAFEWQFITEPNGQVSISHKLAQTMDVFLGLIGDGVNDCAARLRSAEWRNRLRVLEKLSLKAADIFWKRERKMTLRNDDFRFIFVSRNWRSFHVSYVYP